MEVVKLMGIELREYKDKVTKEDKVFCGLHVVYEYEDGSEINGNKCENFPCPREMNPKDLKVGELYELRYEHFKTKNGMGARISGLIPFAQPEQKKV